MSAKPRDKAAEYKALADSIISEWESERDKVFALVACVVRGLEPKDPASFTTGEKFNEWRIAQVIEDMLGDCESLNAVRRMLEGVNHG